LARGLNNDVAARYAVVVLRLRVFTRPEFRRDVLERREAEPELADSESVDLGEGDASSSPISPPSS
jgi:hypothetical protein